VRRNLFVPLPVFQSFDALNAYLDAQCRWLTVTGRCWSEATFTRW
jgi:hypothetical protein